MPAHITHGHSIGGRLSPTMKSWDSMKQRCYNPKAKDYGGYGGRGIKVCDRWFYSFQLFLQDMGERPENYTIDRIDNNGDYTPNNCRWADAETQQRNTRVSKRLTVNGITKPMIDWAKEVDLSYSTLLRRFNAGWPHEKIVGQPRRW